MSPTNAELEAFLDEALPAEVMARIEQSLRGDQALLERLAKLTVERDAGIHSLSGIWRTNRLTCPSRQELGSYLLGILKTEHADFIAFHLQTSGCRACTASVEDLRAQQTEVAATKESRRRRYFE